MRIHNKKIRPWLLFLALLLLSLSIYGCGAKAGSTRTSSGTSVDTSEGTGTNETAGGTDDDTNTQGSEGDTSSGSDTNTQGSGGDTDGEGDTDTEGSEGDTTETNAGSTGTDADGTTVSSGAKGTWDNSIKVLTPTLGGTAVIGTEALQVDISNLGEGYLMARYTGAASRIKFFILTPDGTRYTYDIYPSETYTVIPLTAGNGGYTIDVREHVEADLYANLFEAPIDVTLTDEFLPFLYPNQYSNFTAESTAVQKAAELTETVDDVLGAISAVYDYVISHVRYDEEKAKDIKAGYLPDIDETLSLGTGICFDYAALFAAMLRSQGIPTKLEIGYSGEIYHAWISVYSEEHGWIDNILEFDGDTWELMDPTLAANNDSGALSNYIGEGTNYTVKYSR